MIVLSADRFDSETCQTNSTVVGVFSNPNKAEQFWIENSQSFQNCWLYAERHSVDDPIKPDTNKAIFVIDPQGNFEALE